MRKFLAVICCLLIFGGFIYMLRGNPQTLTDASLSCDDFNLSKSEDVFANASDQKVILGGMPLGITLKSKGLIIIGKTDIITEFGLKSTVKDNDIIPGDILFKVEGQEVNTAKELSEIINLEKNGSKTLNIMLIRHGKEMESKLSPQLDAATKLFKAGLWVREETYGIGTLTYIKCDDLSYGALGHPVTDPDINDILPIISGTISDCSISGVIKGERGKAGELKGALNKAENRGSVDKNNMFGIFGKFSKPYVNPLYKDPVQIMARKDIKPGKAKIICTVNGDIPKAYDIEIIKNFNHSKPSDKNLVIKITDKELLNITGGIVQGMSGSPIIQNGKLCGAVTHVFINDPTKGYGIYADWMVLN